MTAALWPDWRASLIDASASDWITVAAYLLAAVITFRAAHTAGQRIAPRERLFWALAAGLLLLNIALWALCYALLKSGWKIKN